MCLHLYQITEEKINGKDVRGGPSGGGGPLWGRQPPMWVLYGENVCENERIGSLSSVSVWTDYYVIVRN